MAKRMIKHLMFTHFDKVEDPLLPGGYGLKERIARLGEEVEISDEYIRRGERADIDAFYTAAEAKAIKAGTYKGVDAAAVYAARSGQRPAPLIEAIEGEHGDVNQMDAPQLAAFMLENKLSIPKVLQLVPEDADGETLQKFVDAENIATSNSPRDTLIAALEKRISDLGDD